MNVFNKTSQIIANNSESLTNLKDLEVSDAFYSESDIDIKHQDSTKIYIQLPVDPNGDISDVDSADEEESSFLPLASAVLEIKGVGKFGIVLVEESHSDPQNYYNHPLKSG